MLKHLKRKETSAQSYFTEWMNDLMRRNKMHTNAELYNAIGITKQCLYNWREHPSRLSRRDIAGIIFMLGDEKDDFDFLCKMFKITK